MWALMGLGSVIPTGGAEPAAESGAGSEFDCSFPASCPQPWRDPFGIQTAWFRGQGPSFGGGNAGLATRVDPRTGQHYAVTYQNQRGAVPGAGVFAKPLRVLPITGLAGMGAADVGLPFGGMGSVTADEAASTAARVDAIARDLILMRRLLLAARSAGYEPKPDAVRAYTNGKLNLALALSRACGLNPNAKMRLPRELGIHVEGGCLALYDLPPSPGSEGEVIGLAGLGIVPVIPLVALAVGGLVSVIVAPTALKYIDPETYRYLAAVEFDKAVYTDAIEACEDAACKMAVVAQRRQMEADMPAPRAPKGLMDELSGVLTAVVGVAALVILGPPIIGALSKRG